ncbi:ADP-ribosylarginine hydrolase Tri1 [Methanocorpusculaceae archaeon Sp1]|uniref:ADP-ribosylarginine hydrolase Tri1 n=1 Tax=Methanorbis furvi TaxID=3028299 RepID=A0AAE4SAC9_9EURY|nr:ADP-ribosylarginine hydrolase Tri1 [Methanocorpusculaceae archaeon Sp1]MDV0442221.1 ADP-ribosylarginine hydrolase Tri1 [Methanocorpusculaceae archaeon Ag1]
MRFISENDRISGGMFGAAAGDAVGLTFEGMMPAPRRSLTVTGGGQFGLVKGAVTDDTLMMLAVAEACKSSGQIDRDLFFRRMILTVAEEPQTFGRTTKMFCSLLEQGCFADAAAKTIDLLFGSRTNGSVMRTLPVGLICQMDCAAETARNVSAFTHFSPAAGDCCAAVSVMASVLLNGGGKQEACDAGMRAAGYDIMTGKLIPSVDAVESTRCAVFCFLEGNSVRDVIERAVSLGGDTDTIAAIAGGLAGVYYGVSDVPKEWMEMILIRKRIAAAAEKISRAGRMRF